MDNTRRIGRVLLGFMWPVRVRCKGQEGYQVECSLMHFPMVADSA